MKILFTGASSFTGYHFINALIDSGNAVTATFTKSNLEAYSGIRKIRVSEIIKNCSSEFNCCFGDDKFFSLLTTDNFDILCHHGAVVDNYRSQNFDILNACKVNTKNIDKMSDILSKQKIPFVITGSYFEKNEGAGSDNLPSPTPYTISKTLSFEIINYYCLKNDVQLAKFVIPNPFGPLEEERFTTYLMREWFQRKAAMVQNPNYIRDNIHTSLLASVYAKFIVELKLSGTKFFKVNPSQYVGKQRDFALKYAQAMKERLNLPCELEFSEKQNFHEPMIRFNTDNAELKCPSWDEKKAWDKNAEYYENVHKAGLL